MWFLGMDVGTGGTRAVVVDAAGKLMGTASSEHAPFRAEHPGWAEQDPEDWWRAAQNAIRGALAATTEPREPIEAIALTGQMHGAVMLDEAGAVLRPALIWCDTRTQPECDWLTEKIGYERLIELTCNPALPNFTLTKLLWVKVHQPEIFAKIRHVMCPKDYVRYRLTGEFAIDVQEASGTLLLDVTHRRWSREVAEAAGIDMSWLPKVYESPEICARISEKAAGLTGLKAGTPVAAGAGDQGAGAVGMGILQPGSVSATIGTSGVVFRGHGRADKRSEGTAAHVLPRRAGPVARDGRNAERGAESELAARNVFRRPELRRAERRRGEDSRRAARDWSGRRICSASARRISILKSARHLRALACSIRGRILCARCWRAWRTRSRTRSPSFTSWAFR